MFFSSCGLPIRPTTRHGLGPAHGLLEDTEQGGVIFKGMKDRSSRIARKVVIELELFYCNRLGLYQYALPSRLYKERRELTPCTINHTQQPNAKVPRLTRLGYYVIQRPEPV